MNFILKEVATFGFQFFGPFKPRVFSGHAHFTSLKLCFKLIENIYLMTSNKFIAD